MSRLVLRFAIMSTLVACAEPGLADEAPTRLRDLEVDGEPERGDLVKTFVGPGGRTMWLGLEDWCDDNCHQGFYLGLFDGAAPEPAWTTDMFAVPGYGGDMWTARVQGERVIVASERHVWVVDGG